VYRSAGISNNETRVTCSLICKLDWTSLYILLRCCISRAPRQCQNARIYTEADAATPWSIRRRDVDGAVAAGTAVAQLYEPGELARHPLLLVSSHVKARRTAGQAESSAGTPFSSEHTPACATRQTDGGHGFNGRRRVPRARHVWWGVGAWPCSQPSTALLSDPVASRAGKFSACSAGNWLLLFFKKN
jgi:hypothetical protein